MTDSKHPSPAAKGNSFLWGAATSSHQIEGNNLHNDWWQWEQAGFIEKKQLSGLSIDHWNHVDDDLDHAKNLGLNSYRFSVEWSRIEPSEGQWSVEAVEWYQRLVAGCEARGILPMLTLHHFTSPAWFADLGGFTHPKAHEYFGRFVEKIIVTLGARIPIWCTINEPMVLVTGTYLGNFMPPATFSPEKASLATSGLLRCHVKAYDLIHQIKPEDRKGPWKDHPLMVGFAHNMLDFKPLRIWHPGDQLLTGLVWRFYNQSWLDAISGKKQNFGLFQYVPKSPVVTEALNRVTSDFIGLNYYTKVFLATRILPQTLDGQQLEGHVGNVKVPFELIFKKSTEHGEVSEMGWTHHPQGLFKLLKFLKRYRLPLYITENGIADASDQLRPRYLKEHLDQLAHAIDQGIDVRGYFHWSLLDNFEWIKGFDPRFGLIQVNYETFERKITDSGKLYQYLIQAHKAQKASEAILGASPNLSILEAIFNEFNQRKIHQKSEISLIPPLEDSSTLPAFQKKKAKSSQYS